MNPHLVRRLATAGVAIVLAASCLAACSSSNTAGASSGTATLRLGLDYIATVENFAPYYAQTQGLYKKAGLNVEIDQGGNTSPATLVEAGRDDIGQMDGTDLLNAEPKDPNLVAIAAEFQTLPEAMTCRADSGVTSVEDLPGHTLGLRPDADTFLTFIAHAADVPTHELHIVPAGASDISAIIAGKIDCLFTTYAFNEPYAIRAAGVPVNVIPLAKMGLPAQGDVFFTTRQFLAAHRAELVKWVSATAKAWGTFLNSPSRAAGYMIKHAFAPGLELSQQRDEAAGMVPFLTSSWTKTHGLMALNPATWHTTARVGYRMKLTNSQIATPSILDDQIVADADTPKR